jgi:hypothetical protein
LEIIRITLKNFALRIEAISKRRVMSGNEFGDLWN